VIGFPLGFHTVRTKVFETEEAVARGAGEIDFVANRAWVRSGRYDLVGEEIGSVVKAAGAAPVKVIMETSDLSLDEQFHVCDAAIEAGAAFVKTSTGFNGGGATKEAVQAMLETAAGRARVKPSGGIRDYATAKMYVDMGAQRLGIGFASAAAIARGEGTDENY
jgi:deoxyribose-phosphate aldolase